MLLRIKDENRRYQKQFKIKQNSCAENTMELKRILQTILTVYGNI
jgi:hypothetical protein